MRARGGRWYQGAPSVRFSNTVSVGTSIECWNTVLIPASRLAEGLASLVFSPCNDR